MIAHKPFGKIPSGQTVDEYTITNAKGAILRVITYGGIITELHVPDRNGKWADVVCGFDNLDQYLAGHPYFGCVVGRVAGRITGAKFTLDGKTYSLAVNDPPNHLHGGIVGWDKKVWTVDGTTGNSISMICTSPDGEEGYPGKVTTRMTYTLSDKNEFIIDYEAITDRATPLCLTNHSYFNLAGEGNGLIHDHILQIHAKYYSVADEKMTQLGRREVVNAQNDFNSPRKLEEAIPKIWMHHGDAYFIQDKPSNKPILAAKISDPHTGRVITLRTTEPCVQFYTGVMMPGTHKGKSGQVYKKYGAFCLEAQRYADGANHPELGDIILRPGQVYRQNTVHAFSAE